LVWWANISQEKGTPSKLHESAISMSYHSHDRLNNITNTYNHAERLKVNGHLLFTVMRPTVQLTLKTATD